MDVGRVVQLARYPVKSLRGESLDAVEVDERGLRGDRAWAAYTPDGGIGSGKTTRRFRRVDGLLDHASTLDGGAAPVLTLASGARHRCGEPGTDAALSAAVGRELALRPETDVRHHDEAPVHVLTTASLRHLERLLGAPVDVRRLRSNVLLEVEGDGFVEDGWIGRDLRLSDVVLALGPGMPRCVMVDAAQAGVASTPRMLRTLGRVNDTQLGLQASVRSGGVVRLGDVARLL
ncbi:MAG: MOSC domain-containing protein [Blastococcus sp.]